MTVTAQSDARDLLSALREAHEEHVAVRVSWALGNSRTTVELIEHKKRRDAAAARCRELDTWLQAKLCAMADRTARLEAALAATCEKAARLSLLVMGESYDVQMGDSDHVGPSDEAVRLAITLRGEADALLAESEQAVEAPR